MIRCGSLNSLSTYCPKLENTEKKYRYDGIYKVRSYHNSLDADSSVIVYKFSIQRDDPEPAPWSKDGILVRRYSRTTYILEPTFTKGETSLPRNSTEGSERDDQ